MPEKREKDRWSWFDRVSEVWSLLEKIGLSKLVIAAGSASVIFVGSYLKRLPWPITVTCGLVVFAVVLWLSKLIPIGRKISVRLIPASGPSSVQLLNVKNLGAEQTFRAECTLLARRNDPNELHHSSFRLEWEGAYKRSVKLRSHGSCNLVIAEAGRTVAKDSRGNPNPVEWLRICGLSEDGKREAKQTSRWSHGDPLPEYDVEITIIGNSGQRGLTEMFTVRAGTTSAIVMESKS